MYHNLASKETQDEEMTVMLSSLNIGSSINAGMDEYADQSHLIQSSIGTQHANMSSYLESDTAQS